MPSFTVVHADGMTKDSESREYDQLLNRDLLKRNVNLARVPRVEEPGTENKWLYVWPEEDEARDFAIRLNKQTKASHWIIQPLPEGTRPSIGPLRPIEIQVGYHPSRYVFALDTWAFLAIQGLFPGSCQMRTVSVSSKSEFRVPTDPDGLREIVRPTLLLLTGLNVEQLSVFHEFVVRDPVTHRELLPPTPIRPERFFACGNCGSKLENGEEVPGVPKSGKIVALAGQ